MRSYLPNFHFIFYNFAIFTLSMTFIFIIFACDQDPEHDHDHDHEHGKAEETSSGEDGYPLKTCIVEDENKLDSMGEPYVHVWKVTTVKFCCEGCLEDFEKEPEKYLAKLETANKGEAPANPEGESK